MAVPPSTANALTASDIAWPGGKPPVIVAVQRPAPAYDGCFYPALEKLGVSVVDGSLTGRWLAKHLNRGDYVHLQYPSFFYAGAPNRRGLVFDFTRFVLLLLLVRARGAKLLWTAHNLAPHEPTPFPGMDRLGRIIVIGLSYRVFAHSKSAAARIREHYPQVDRKLVVIEHGNWIGHYPNTVSKSEARSRLGINASDYVFLFIGLCKAYKNVHGLIDAFGKAATESILVVAGRFQNPDYQQTILGLADGNERIKIYPQRVPNEELQVFLGACDCVVLPYRDILTSGVVMLAMSFGRPILSIRTGTVQDAVTDDVGVLIDAGDPDALEKGLLEIRGRQFDQETIVAQAGRFSWDNSARTFIDSLRR
jgi:beta-1,4-mannosyltransferase